MTHDSDQPTTAPEPEPVCDAYYGLGDGGTAICGRPLGHPEVSVDGIGHAPGTVVRRRAHQ